MLKTVATFVNTAVILLKCDVRQTKKINSSFIYAKAIHCGLFYSISFEFASINSEYKVTAWFQQMSLEQLKQSYWGRQTCKPAVTTECAVALRCLHLFSSLIYLCNKSTFIFGCSSRHIQCTCVALEQRLSTLLSTVHRLHWVIDCSNRKPWIIQSELIQSALH